MESSLKYLSLFESLSDAIIIIDKRGIIEDVNNAGLQLFGFEKSELLGQNVNIIMPNPHKKNHDLYINNYLRTGVKKIIGIGREVNAVKKNGTVFPSRLSVSKFTIEDEIYFTGIIQDLTAQKNQEEIIRRYSEELELMVKKRTNSLRQEIELKEKAEDALKRSQVLYENISKNYPNGAIIVVNTKGKIEFAEGTELNPFGEDRDEIVNQSIFDLIPPNCIEKFKNEIAKAQLGDTVSFEMSINNNFYNVQTVPLFERNKTINQILLVKTNITAQKKAEQDMLSALEREKELSELKNNFVSTASHEFRTPLTSIASSASLIAKYVTTEQQNDRIRHLEKIKNNVQHLTQVLNDFLSLEKIESGKFGKEAELLNIPTFFEHIIDEFKEQCKDNQTIQHIGFYEQTKFTLNSDMLKHVIFNLVSNAIKYSDEDVIIEVNLNENLQISIKDKGIGISKADQKHLFERFFRASNAVNIQGTGLGLNIVKSYLDKMNGSITFDSELGMGSTFTITFYESY